MALLSFSPRAYLYPCLSYTVARTVEVVNCTSDARPCRRRDSKQAAARDHDVGAPVAGRADHHEDQHADQHVDQHAEHRVEHHGGHREDRHADRRAVENILLIDLH